MTKAEVKKALDKIMEMSDEDIAINGVYIRKVAESAFSLIKNLEKRCIAAERSAKSSR